MSSQSHRVFGDEKTLRLFSSIAINTLDRYVVDKIESEKRGETVITRRYASDYVGVYQDVSRIDKAKRPNELNRILSSRIECDFNTPFSVVLHNIVDLLTLPHTEAAFVRSLL